MIARGYPALLNVEEQPHWTIFISDFALPAADVRRLQRQLQKAGTRSLFLAINGGLNSIRRRLRVAGVNLRSDYVSFHALVFRHDNSLQIPRLLEMAPRCDVAKVELPAAAFQPSFASHLLDVVMQADYAAQERIAERFFTLLARRKPYRVSVTTSAGKLVVADRRPWFDFSGRLREGEFRILPAGEVSYAGSLVEGEFAVDGAILPFPEHPELNKKANGIGRLSRSVGKRPLHLKIRNGEVAGIAPDGKASDALMRLFDEDDRYRRVVEVGIAFNDASRKFIHHWPASSNEVHPGVHLGLGGDPSRDHKVAPRLIHIDLISANCEVAVNGQRFLKAVS